MAKVCLLNCVVWAICAVRVHSMDVQLSIGDQVVQSIDMDQFLSFTFDTSFIRGNFCGINWLNAILLIRALTPCHMRLGGDDSDFLVFRPDNEKDRQWTDEMDNRIDANGCDMFAHSFFNMTTDQFDRINWLVESTGVKLMHNLNLIYGRENFTWAPWDPTNIIELLDYASRMGYPMDFELGNEPDVFGYWYKRTVNGTELVKDYKRMRRILDSYPLYKKSKLIGPAVASVYHKIYKEFLQAGGLDYVDVVSFHHYYARSGHLPFFLNPRVLDSLKPFLKRAVSLVKQYSTRDTEVWLGETGTTYEGGSYGLSDSYVAGFMWLDKLGLCALYGVNAVFRHTFFMGNFAITDDQTMPRPDYWLSLLFKTFVAEDVLNVRVSVANASLTSHLRFYAHRNQTHITLFGMNLLNEGVNVKISGRQKEMRALEYLMEPEEGNLTATNVLLNGHLPVFDQRHPPNLLHSGLQVTSPFKLPAFRYVLWIFPRQSTL